MNAHGGGSEFRFFRTEPNGLNSRNIAALGTGVSFVAEGKFGVGGTNPTAKMQVGFSPNNYGDVTTLGVSQQPGDTVALSLRRVGSDPIMQFCGDGAGGCSYLAFNRTTGDIGIGADGNGANPVLSVEQSSGNAGIGTAPTSRRLTVGGDAKITGSIFSGWADISGTGDTAVTRYSNVTATGSNRALLLNAGSGTVRIARNGNVGIGSSTPQSTLHVSEGGTAQSSSFTGNTPGTLRLWGGSYVEGGYTNIDFSNSGTGGAIGRIGVSNTGAGSGLSFGTSNNYGTGITNEAMVIDPSGNVGIGAATPSTDLHVDGNVRVTVAIVTQVIAPGPRDRFSAALAPGQSG